VLYDATATAVPAGPRRDTTSTRSLMTLAAIIEHFDLRHVALVGHSLRTRELVRYLTRHGDARVDERVLVGPTTPMLRQTTDNPTAGIRSPLTPTMPPWPQTSRGGTPTAGDAEAEYQRQHN
jgi:pimeloyl-ACP methyl ester carboxylesterase